MPSAFNSSAAPMPECIISIGEEWPFPGIGRRLARFNQGKTVGSVLAEACREHRAGAARADDDIIEPPHLRHARDNGLPALAMHGILAHSH